MRRRILRVIPIGVALATLGMSSEPFGGCWWGDVHRSEPGELSPEVREQLEREQGRPHEKRPPDQQIPPVPRPEIPDEGGGPSY